MKRLLDEEYDIQKRNLNSSFKTWVNENKKKHLGSDWSDAVHDYLAYGIQLKSRYDVTGQVFSFGTGDCGQLGHGVENDDKDTFVVAPRAIDRLKDKSIHALACGAMHNGAVCDGTVWTWGCGDDECLGRPVSEKKDEDENYPTPVTSLKNAYIVQITMGDCHTAVLDISGRVFVWGTYRDKDGKRFFPGESVDECFGIASREPYLMKVPSDAAKHGGCRQIYSGSSHTLALCGDGTVFSWGLGDSGQLGRPVCEMKENELYQKEKILREHLTPSVMLYEKDNKPVSDARYVACGNHHSFIIRYSHSEVYGCGLNQYSQLALSQGEDSKCISQLRLIPALKNILFVYGGEHSSLAITHDGDILTFGRADNSQLGVSLSKELEEAGGFTGQPQLVKFNPPKKFVGACCGSFHCVAMAEDGSVYSWGFGEMGQLGHGNSGQEGPVDEKVPRQLVMKKTNEPWKVTALAAGAQHTIILKSKQ